MGNTPDEDRLDLADAIALLRGQIAEAQGRLNHPDGRGSQGVVFGLGEITLELGMELTRTRGADAGLRFSVVSLGGKAEKAAKSTHKVTVRLQPRASDDGPVRVGDKE
ncbi:trypco2 family protein [Kitasatospora sp. A2-31]|uniref:trypco2 family protein n=1 Tax=Kitasatospora sp. A2-31 TaxID=2916414 RepID=UPI001EEA7EDB|nr:trypco2 family protein [Kitasatospora sp. A2-31]MCG6497814.1 hypothetical protein [Kitasatospora sp. A2-31]